jgi:hypothetical protein
MVDVHRDQSTQRNIGGMPRSLQIGLQERIRLDFKRLTIGGNDHQAMLAGGEGRTDANGSIPVWTP